MQSNGMDVEKLRSVVKGKYGSQVEKRTLHHSKYTYPTDILLDIDMGFGHVTVDTPLEYIRSVPGTVPAVRVSTALRQSDTFREDAEKLAGEKNVSLQIGDNPYALSRAFSERTYSFSSNLDYLGSLPKEGVLYRFFVIENDLENILEKILDIRTVADKLRHYANNFQADIGCFGPPQQGHTITHPKAKI